MRSDRRRLFKNAFLISTTAEQELPAGYDGLETGHGSEFSTNGQCLALDMTLTFWLTF